MKWLATQFQIRGRATYTVYLFQVDWRQGHACQQLPHGLSKMEVERFPGPHCNAQQDAQELEVLVVPGHGGSGVQHEAVRVEPALVGSVGSGDEQGHDPILQLLQNTEQPSRDSTDIIIIEP